MSETKRYSLAREDLVNLVRGTQPSYSAMNHPMVSLNGSYRGGFHDDWSWSIKASMTEEQLWVLYHIVKSR